MGTGFHARYDRGQSKPDESSTDRMLEGRQLAETQVDRCFSVPAIPAKGSRDGILGLSDLSSAQITSHRWGLYHFLKRKHLLKPSRQSHTKPPCWAGQTLLAPCLQDVQFVDVLCDFKSMLS